MQQLSKCSNSFAIRLNNASYKLTQILLFLSLTFVLSACSVQNWSDRYESCKSRAYTNASVEDYIRTRFHSQNMIRAAVIPFDVPEIFARSGNESENYGQVLAQKFHQELLRAGTVGIVELFARDTWPGKREEFFSGNYGAIELARNAGYDLVIVGYLDPLNDDRTLSLQTKIIDVSTNATVWYGQTEVESKDRAWKSVFSRARLLKQRPDRFVFPDRTDALINCTVAQIQESDLVPN